MYLGEVYGLCGDKEKALKYLKRVEVDWGGFKYLPRLASISFLIQDRGLELAIKEVQDIVDAIRDKGTSINLSCAYSVLFSLKLAAGKEKEARDILETYISEFKEDIILRTYTTDTESLLPFFRNIFMEGDHLELMERVFLLGGKKSIPFLQILEKNGDKRVATKARELLETRFSATIEPLTIRMLGPFKVSRGEQALTAGNWKSKKALTALKYLAAHRDKGYVPRDVLMELLWPEAPLESAQKNLNSALTSLRKTLEPKAGRDPSSYVLSRADTLSLETGPAGWIDIEVFREKLGLAYQAKEVGDFDLYFHALHEATELYEGDFCSEDLYEDWCSQEREALKNEFMRLLMNLSIEYLRRGEFEEALRCLERAAAKDPGREDVYRQQMTICSQAATARASRRHIGAVRDTSRTIMMFRPPPRPPSYIRNLGNSGLSKDNIAAYCLLLQIKGRLTPRRKHIPDIPKTYF